MIAQTLSARFRKARDVRLRALISELHAERGAVRILDVGGTVEYWRRVGFDFLTAKGCEITVLNLGDGAGLVSQLPRIEHVRGNGCDLSQFREREFDLAHSNSVIEHVGTWAHMKAFAAETARVGRRVYIQTPYFWFPVDPHHPYFPLFHWLPRHLAARALTVLPISTAGRVGDLDKAYDALDHTVMLDRTQVSHLFPDARLHGERVFGLTKSLVAIR